MFYRFSQLANQNLNIISIQRVGPPSNHKQIAYWAGKRLNTWVGYSGYLRDEYG